MLKRYLSEAGDGLTPNTWWTHDEAGSNKEASIHLKRLLKVDHLFQTPKPEKLVHRVLALATNRGDLVVDCYAGSGTTGAVAHKMGRRWIMIEKGDHCRTHIVPRLKAVVDGSDQGGVSKPLGWKGGGGFRYYELGTASAPRASAPASPQLSMKPLPAGLDLDDFLESHTTLFDEESTGRGRRRR